MNENDQPVSAKEVIREYVSELESQATSPIVWVEGTFVYLRPGDGTMPEGYPVPLNECATARGICFWSRQLAEKTWVTKEHLLMFWEYLSMDNNWS